MRGTLTPLDFSATSSLSADIRPNTSSRAVRKPHGIVKVSENGSTSAMNASTVAMGTSGLLIRTSSSCLKRLPSTSTRLRTTTPKKAVAITLMLTYRSIIFIKSHSFFCPTPAGEKRTGRWN